jgi:hypothetical protein
MRINRPPTRIDSRTISSLHRQQQQQALTALLRQRSKSETRINDHQRPKTRTDEDKANIDQVERNNPILPTRRRTARIRQDTVPPPTTQQTGCSTTTRPLRTLKSMATDERLGKREVAWTVGGKGYSPQTNYHHRKEGDVGWTKTAHERNKRRLSRSEKKQQTHHENPSPIWTRGKGWRRRHGEALTHHQHEGYMVLLKFGWWGWSKSGGRWCLFREKVEDPTRGLLKQKPKSHQKFDIFIFN